MTISLHNLPSCFRLSAFNTRKSRVFCFPCVSVPCNTQFYKQPRVKNHERHKEISSFRRIFSLFSACAEVALWARLQFFPTICPANHNTDLKEARKKITDCDSLSLFCKIAPRLEKQIKKPIALIKPNDEQMRGGGGRELHTETAVLPIVFVYK